MSAQEEKHGPSVLESWLRVNSGLALIGVGVCLVVLGVVGLAETPVSTAVAAIGAGAMVLGVLLPRIEGAVKLGPGGLEFFLQAVAARSEAAQLDDEEREEALQTALQRWTTASVERAGEGVPSKSFSYNWDRLLEELADDVVRDVAEMHQIAVDEVPGEALEEIRQTANLPELPHVRAAERRGGRGAPRWRIETDAGIWRVSNTRHGWTATRDAE